MMTFAIDVLALRIRFNADSQAVAFQLSAP